MSILITGASSGIGEACASILAANGRDLVLLARRKERLYSMAERLSCEHNVQVSFFAIDVRDRLELVNTIEKHPHIFAKIDVLINNAGLAKGLSPLYAADPLDFDTVIDTNVKGLLYMTHAILPSMITNDKGHIINIGSVAGHWVYENGAVYCASKFAVKALTEGLRLDLRGTKLRVTEISPGMVESEFSEVRLGSKEKAKMVYANKTPLKPIDIAEAVLWCIDRPAHVNVQEIILYPTEQVSVHSIR
jgi:NADP-dependent 3-hydroxy acid dehydrogenase YdfG